MSKVKLSAYERERRKILGKIKNDFMKLLRITSPLRLLYLMFMVMQ